MKYTDILIENERMGKELKGPPFRITILSNIIVHQLRDILEFQLRSKGINAHVAFGNYDNIAQEAGKMDGDVNAVIVFWELVNFTEGLEYRADLLSDREQEEIRSGMSSGIELALDGLRNKSLVLFNKFSTQAFSNRKLDTDTLEKLAAELNNRLYARNQSNLRIVDTDKILSLLGIQAGIDFRNYNSSKALYTVDFQREYASRISDMILPLAGKMKKALVFDCDNTLWSGILGEDGIDGISMDGNSHTGKAFAAVQSMAVKLAREGVIIGLCSKNNAADVDEVLRTHRHMILKDDHITVKKVNWTDKATNLRQMAAELNIGLDSIVFVEDSEFEIGLVNKELPEVETFRVNNKIHLYPVEFSGLMNRFYRLSRSREDLDKNRQYKQQAEREAMKSSFSSIRDYLASLQIEVDFLKNDAAQVPRMAQMTQKTNQFNLTTRRYSEAEIEGILKSGRDDIYALSVKDRFGDSGITGLAIVRNGDGMSFIDSFLLSCRIIGRGIEDEFLKTIVDDARSGVITAEFLPTAKNSQVSEFYDKFGFEAKTISGGGKKYKLSREKFRKQDTSHIKVLNGRET